MNFESQVTGEDIAVDEETLRSRRRKIVVVSLLLFVAIYAAIILLRMITSDEPQAVEIVPPVVTVVVPGRTDITTTVNATGSLAARREMPVGVVGEGGAVQAVLVEPGDWVSAGQVLARVERSVQTEQARSSAASLAVAQADARLAQAELERAQALVARGFISKADIDRKTATRDQAAARVRVAEAQYREQQARNGRLDIRAPAAGLVLSRSVEPGQIVSASSGVLFRIARAGEMEMLAKVSETDLPRISVGTIATITPVGGAQSYEGRVWQISPVIDPQSRQGTARIALSFDKNIRPGGFATASIASGRSDVPVLPESALQNDPQGSFVLVVNAGNNIERRAVTVGQVSKAGVTVTSGLSGSEKVVALAGGFLTVGQKVKPAVQGQR